MKRVRKKEIARPTRLKLLVRRQRRMLRPIALAAVSFVVVIAA